MANYRPAMRIILFVIVLALFMAVMHRFIIPVILGLLISLVFRPIFRWLQKLFGGRKHPAAGLSTMLVASCVLLPLILVGIFVVRDAVGLVNTLKQVASPQNDGQTAMSIPALSNLYTAINRVHHVSEKDFLEFARARAAAAGTALNHSVQNVVAKTPKKVIGVVFFLISFYFGLLDGPRLVKFLREDLPYSPKETDELFETTHRICNAVILGTLAAGCVQGTIIGLCYWALGIPRPALFGVLTAIFSFVPLVGSAPTGLGGALYLLAAGRPVASLIMAIGFVVAGLSDNVVKPWVLKGKGELHPLLGLLSVLGGIGAFGFAGLFLGPLVTALTILMIHLTRRRTAAPATTG